MTRPITILYFAWLREKAGKAEENLSLPPSIVTLGDLTAHLRAKNPGFDSAFATPRLVRAAVNQVFATPETPIVPGDEVAFFPPVTGG